MPCCWTFGDVGAVTYGRCHVNGIYWRAVNEHDGGRHYLPPLHARASVVYHQRSILLPRTRCGTTCTTRRVTSCLDADVRDAAVNASSTTPFAFAGRLRISGTHYGLPGPDCCLNVDDAGLAWCTWRRHAPWFDLRSPQRFGAKIRC